MNDSHDLTLLLKSRVPIVALETHEEERAVGLLKKVATELGLQFRSWSASDGIAHDGDRSATWTIDGLPATHSGQVRSGVANSNDPESALRAIKRERKPTLFALLDFHPYLSEALHVRLLKEVAIEYGALGHTIVLVSHAMAIPSEIQRYSARFELAMPDSAAIERLVEEEAKVFSLRNAGQKVRADRETVSALVRNLLGLTVSDAKRLIRNAIFDDGAITQNDLPQVTKAKFEMLGQDGVIAFEYDTAKFSEVGGLHKLKAWLERRRDHFIHPKDGFDIPKGIMLLGVQGGGKSLAAKAVAGMWGVPLLRLDFGTLYNKYFGETERNIREALKMAQLMAPCVLWCDEIEKGVASGDQDSGTSKRVLATLLTWMAENKAPVFIVATANDISSLPPELVRKGRLDEIFFVDLPGVEVRAEIFSIHLQKRKLNPASFDLAQLARLSEGFSGAEIEQAVVAARYSAHADGQDAQMEHVLEEIRQTRPLSVVMAENISNLRAWAQNRTVTAD